MNEEEEKAIEILQEFKKTGYHTLRLKYNEDRIHTNKLIEQALETVLNLIETQKAEIKKRDMIIDRMTEYIMTHSSVPTLRHRFCPNYEKEECRIDCRDTIMKSKCIIEYFTKLAEEEK